MFSFSPFFRRQIILQVHVRRRVGFQHCRLVLGVVQILTNTVNKYFGYVAWGLVIAAWVAGFLIWMVAFSKVNAFLKPFLVCPRCGHTIADKRTAMGLLSAFQPWKWF